MIEREQGNAAGIELLEKHYLNRFAVGFAGQEAIQLALADQETMPTINRDDIATNYIQPTEFEHSLMHESGVSSARFDRRPPNVAVATGQVAAANYWRPRGVRVRPVGRKMLDAEIA